MLDVPDERVGLAYDSEIRSLDMQASSLDELRSRAGTLFAVASLIATLLGGETLQAKGLHSAPVWAAIVSLIGSSFLTLLIVWPWRWWQFRIDGAAVLDLIKDTNISVDEIRRRIVRGTKYGENDSRIRKLERLYQGAGFLVVAQLVAWLIAL